VRLLLVPWKLATSMGRALDHQRQLDRPCVDSKVVWRVNTPFCDAWSETKIVRTAGEAFDPWLNTIELPTASAATSTTPRSA
jgi:hypothetical protein